MQLGDLSGKHIGKMITIRGKGTDSWAWELKALLIDVRHHVRKDQRVGSQQKTTVSVMLKEPLDNHQLISFEFGSDYEIDDPQTVRG